MLEEELIQADNMSDPRPNGHPQSLYGADQEGQGEIEDMELDELAAHIQKTWEVNKRDKTQIEQVMLDMQEAVNNLYDSATLSAIKAQGGSEVFIPLTSQQCSAGASWLTSVLTPPGDKAFSFKPRPVPDMSESMQEELKKATIAKMKRASTPQKPQLVPQGQPAPAQLQPLGDAEGNPVSGEQVETSIKDEQDAVKKEIKKESVKRAEKMETLVHDQLLDSGWYQTLEDFITDLTVMPTAFIKTTYEYKKKMATIVSNDTFNMEVTEDLIAKDERVSSFDIYPSPDQTCVHNGSMIERLKLTRSAIYDCLDKPGYNNSEILQVLQEFDSNSTSFNAWQGSVDSSRRHAENHSSSFSGQDGSLYGLRLLGPVAVSKLMDWGLTVDALIQNRFISEEDARDEERLQVKEIDIDAILIGNHVIKVIPNLDPEGKRPFYMASYRRVPGSFWGKSIAMLASPHQRMVNASARALNNNMGIASGPQIVVYTDRLPNGESLQAIRPWKIWQMTSDPAGSNALPMQFFQPESNATELMNVYQYFSQSVGEVTGIPIQSYSSDMSRMQQGAQTASGMAMQIETASKQIKRAVRNIDTGVIEPRLQYQFRVNMMNPDVDPECKGDMSIHAIGAKSIVARAVENQRAMELLQATANPMDQAVLGPEGRAALLRGVIRGYDMTDVVPSSEDIEKKTQAEASMPKPPSPEEIKLQIEQIRAEVRIKDQELENQNAQAQRDLDLQIANLEVQMKEKEIQIAQIQNQEQAQSKLKEIALKESNANARFSQEIALKEQGKTGV